MWGLSPYIGIIPIFRLRPYCQCMYILLIYVHELLTLLNKLHEFIKCDTFVIISGLDEVKLSQDEYSLQHIKAFGINNQLISDPWNPHVVFFIGGDWHIFRLIIHMVMYLKIK